MTRSKRIPLLVAAMVLASGAAAAEPPTVITLTQTGCQFVESENDVDHGYTPASKRDCETINGRSASERLAASHTLRLKPGRHVFRVTNEDVPYELGFWIRGKSLLERATLPSRSGGGLTRGRSRDYVIDLEPGEYVYSCPLNPTPDYRLVVEDS